MCDIQRVRLELKQTFRRTSHPPFTTRCLLTYISHDASRQDMPPGSSCLAVALHRGICCSGSCESQAVWVKTTGWHQRTMVLYCYFVLSQEWNVCVCVCRTVIGDAHSPLWRLALASNQELWDLLFWWTRKELYFYSECPFKKKKKKATESTRRLLENMKAWLHSLSNGVEILLMS